MCSRLASAEGSTCLITIRITATKDVYHMTSPSPSLPLPPLSPSLSPLSLSLPSLPLPPPLPLSPPPHSSSLPPSPSPFRSLAYSTLADLVHHIRTHLPLPHLSLAVLLFSKNVHDDSLPISIQTISCKLLLNLVECIRLKAEQEPAVRVGPSVTRTVRTYKIPNFFNPSPPSPLSFSSPSPPLSLPPLSPNLWRLNSVIYMCDLSVHAKNGVVCVLLLRVVTS